VRQTNAINKQTYNQQVREARTAAAAEREEAKRTEVYMKQIWNEQVRDYKVMKTKEKEAARESATAEREAAKKAAAFDAAGGNLNALGRLSQRVNGEFKRTNMG